VAAAGRNPDQVAVLLDVEVLLDSDAASARRALDELDAHRELAASSIRVVDTADALVDVIAEAVSGGAADGVTAVPLALPSGVQAIAADVVPRLADRGLRTPVRPGATLRDRFGLPRPANRYVEANA
jgi:alkanesulfonate monooxygenase SsuD/methylene tetrahydromethanopterin reductase-like flavin-dependent oxidoreductase (luciferase family)